MEDQRVARYYQEAHARRDDSSPDSADEIPGTPRPDEAGDDEQRAREQKEHIRRPGSSFHEAPEMEAPARQPEKHYPQSDYQPGDSTTRLRCMDSSHDNSPCSQVHLFLDQTVRQITAYAEPGQQSRNLVVLDHVLENLLDVWPVTHAEFPRVEPDQKPVHGQGQPTGF